MQELRVILTIKAKKGNKKKAIHCLDKYLTQVKSCAGCIDIELLNSNQNPDQIIVIEKWLDSVHFARYLKTDVYRKFVPFISQYASELNFLQTSKIG